MSRIAHFKLNDNLATTNVLAAIGTDGTLVGGNNTQDLSESGKINDTLHFDGSADFVNIGLQSFAASSGSVCCWFKKDVANPTGNKYIIGRNVAGNADGDFAIWNRDSDNTIGVFIQNGVSTFNAYSNSQVNDTNWHWVLAVWSASEVRLYLDNVLQTEAGAGTSLNAHATAPFSIGSVNGSTVGTESWDGLIDDVRIFDHVLSAAERTFFYNAGSGTEDEYYISATFEETVTLDDSWEVSTNPEQDSINETITLDDEWEVYTNPEQDSINETVTLDDSWETLLFSQIFINTDLRWLTSFAVKIKTTLNWILAKTINTDLRWLQVYKKTINTDLRWLSVGYDDLLPIAPADIQIFVNSVDLVLANDIDIQTGNISHTTGDKSVANFTLARRHDDLDRTHLGAASQITNQNPVQIYIKGHLEFDGFISNLAVNSDTETVQVTCLMNEPADNRHLVEIPMASVNEKLNPYHCLVNAVNIDNPKEDEDEPNPKYYKGIQVDLGTKIVQQTDTNQELDVNIGIQGGGYIRESVPGKGFIAQKIEDGTYLTNPNYTYFWMIMATNVILGLKNATYRYIGTSLASTTTDLWVLDAVSPIYQRIKEDIETELGFYTLGSAPFKNVSTNNGKLIIAPKYEDRFDGLYHVYDEHYDYEAFAKRVADLEYEKIKNINGDVLPITTADIDIMLDAYYFYNIKLLTRIGVTNTTVANTYKNLNGFPVSVKSININLSTMRVTLNTSNQLSQEEIDEIDAQMPKEDDPLYLVPEKSTRVFRKFDLKSWSFVG